MVKMNPTLKAQFETVIKQTDFVTPRPINEAICDCMERAYDLRQSEIDALQAKITQFAGIIMDYETKWAVIIERAQSKDAEPGLLEALQKLIKKD